MPASRAIFSAAVRPPVIHSWQDAVDGCHAYLEAKARAGEISPAAVARYVVSWDQITAALGFELDDAGKPKPIPLNGITKATISDFIVAPREEDRATSTTLNDLTACSHVMAYGDFRGWTDETSFAASTANMPSGSGGWTSRLRRTPRSRS
jgi:hypothetical protein